MSGGSTERPLAGRRILVTRSRDQAGTLSVPLARLGAEVLLAPVIRLVDPPDWAPVDQAIGRLAGYHWLVFTSANAVERWMTRVEERGLDARAMGSVRIAAIGDATSQSLAQYGLRVDVVAEEFRAESLGEVLSREPLEGKRILLPRALVARDALPELLRDRGATVDVMPIYATVPDAEGGATARRAFDEGRVDAVTLTSSSIVEAFLGALGPSAGDSEQNRALLAERLAHTCLASIGPVTSATIRAHGLEPAVEASPYTVPALVRALAEHFAAATSRKGTV